jgi:uncharacterized protein
MFATPSGEKLFIVDAHTVLWDGSPANQKNIHGKQFIDCFYDYHHLGPESYIWPKEKFERYTEEDYVKDVFQEGYADVAIFNPQYLGDFYHEGFSNLKRNEAFRRQHPDRIIANGFWDPRNAENGLEQLERDAKAYNWKGVKLYTAEWHGDSKGWKLSDPWAYRYLEKCQELGIKNIHVHKGPTIRPLNKDAFDVGDVDEAATAFTELNFIVEHVGLPRLEDFCYIAAQEPNVYAGLAVASALIHKRPHYFGEILGELLFWLGPDRILYGSDYGIWSPKWIVEALMSFDLPADVAAETGQNLTLDIRRKIMGENAARLYGIEIPHEFRKSAPQTPAEPEAYAPAP